MKIACIGGGPGGLYFAISMKLKNPEIDIDVIERNRANDTFGWGVVLSDDASEYAKDYDVVVASDGLNSKTRLKFKDIFKADIDERKCPFIWLGTNQKFDDAFTFIFEKTKYGWIWAHAYQFDSNTATFIVECSQKTFDAFGFS